MLPVCLVESTFYNGCDSVSMVTGEHIESVKRAVKENGGIWISYPKASRQEPDLNGDILRQNLAERGLKAVSLISIDEIWSAFRFKKV